MIPVTQKTEGESHLESEKIPPWMFPKYNENFSFTLLQKTNTMFNLKPESRMCNFLYKDSSRKWDFLLRVILSFRCCHFELYYLNLKLYFLRFPGFVFYFLLLVEGLLFSWCWTHLLT